MLDQYRKEIDDIDWEILSLLAKRAGVSKEIWQYKKDNNLSALQNDRWNEVLSNRQQTAKMLWLSQEFVTKIWNCIHDESVKIQEK